MTEAEAWTIFLDWLAIFLSIIAIIIATYFSWGKYKLTKKDMWLRSISPEPHVNIWDGKVSYKHKLDELGSEIDEIEGYTITVDIANVTGYANEPKWLWRLKFKNKETKIGGLSDSGISLQVGISHFKISYIPPESQTFHLRTNIMDLDEIKDMDLIESVEIWVNYVGNGGTVYNSYKIFKYINDKWTDEHKRTKVWRVKPRQSTKK